MQRSWGAGPAPCFAPPSLSPFKLPPFPILPTSPSAPHPPSSLSHPNHDVTSLSTQFFGSRFYFRENCSPFYNLLSISPFDLFIFLPPLFGTLSLWVDWWLKTGFGKESMKIKRHSTIPRPWHKIQAERMRLDYKFSSPASLPLHGKSCDLQPLASHLASCPALQL